jgi:hypothetical protein
MGLPRTVATSLGEDPDAQKLAEADGSLFSDAQRKLSQPSQCEKQGRDRGNNRLVIMETEEKRRIHHAGAP